MKYRAVAHRGYAGKYPENSMSSFQAAVDLSFTHIELDVHLSKDGVPIVMHDSTLDRTTNGAGSIRSYTLEQLKRITVGDHDEIPTLREVLKLAKDQIILDIEFKQEGNSYPGMEQIVLDLLKEEKMLDQVFISSFDHYSMAKLRSLSEEIQIALVYYGNTPSAFPFAKEINARYLAVKHNFINEDYIQSCSEHGVELVVWTVDDPKEMRRFQSRPEILVITNELEKWIEVTQETIGS